VTAAQALAEEIMPDARYYVVADHDRWMIKFEDGEYGPYGTHDEAVCVALQAARKLGEHGECVHVCVAGNDGRFRPRWSYGRAPSARIGA